MNKNSSQKSLKIDRALITATWDDVPHLSDETKQSLLASIPVHERDARSKGMPSLGSGRIYPVDEVDIVISPILIPEHWVQIIGMDFGWDHPTCAVRMAWDRDGDCIYVTHTHKLRHGTPVVHASVMKSWGDWIPVAWPHDGFQTEKGTGITLRHRYEDEGVNMLPTHATFEGGGTSVETGIMDVLERMQSGRLKVFSHLSDWLHEFRLYHRRDGRIIKENDDLLDATRYGVMMLREAVINPVNRGDILQSADISYTPDY